MPFTAAQWASPDATTIRATQDDGSELFVPAAEDNRHYREIMQAVDAGDLTIADHEPPPPAVPQSAPKLALVRAMRFFQMDGQLVSDPGSQVSVWQTVQGALAGADPTVQEDWELLTEVPRSDPVMLGVVTNLPFPEGTDPDQMIDLIYTVAAAIAAGQVDPYTGDGLADLIG